MVGEKLHVGAVRLLGVVSPFLGFEPSPRKFGLAVFTITISDDLEMGRKRIDSLGSDAVQTDTELENIVIILCPCVDDRYAINDLP